MAKGDSCITQLIDDDGKFNVDGLKTFTTDVKFSELGISYAVVAIKGPQSSGKSTLLNHLFDTTFTEMDADEGRSQTTKGIWIARAVGIAPCTVIMDVEGYDEKKGARWCNDIGRDQAANRPLLKTVFQVMVQLFNPRKITLLFVIRDKSKTPLETLEAALREDIQQEAYIEKLSEPHLPGKVFGHALGAGAGVMASLSGNAVQAAQTMVTKIYDALEIPDARVARMRNQDMIAEHD